MMERERWVCLFFIMGLGFRKVCLFLPCFLLGYVDRVLLLIVVSGVCSRKSCGEGNEIVLFFLIMDKGVDSSCCLFDWFSLQIALMDSLMMKWNILNLRACLHG